MKKSSRQRVHYYKHTSKCQESRQSHLIHQTPRCTSKHQSECIIKGHQTYTQTAQCNQSINQSRFNASFPSSTPITLITPKHPSPKRTRNLRRPLQTLPPSLDQPLPNHLIRMILDASAHREQSLHSLLWGTSLLQQLRASAQEVRRRWTAPVRIAVHITEVEVRGRSSRDLLLRLFDD